MGVAKRKQRQKEYLEHMHSMIEYWKGVEEQTGKSQIEGFAFSMLVEMDGGGSCDGYTLICDKTGEHITNGYLHEIMNDFKK
jgi:hypothetical protein